MRGREVPEPSKEAISPIETYERDVDFLEEVQPDLGVQTKQIAVVRWEDITAYSRVEIPEDFEVLRLSKITVGLLWKEAEDYLVLVQDYDLTNKGKGYRHNDFHIIPKGTIKEITVLGEVSF